MTVCEYSHHVCRCQVEDVVVILMVQAALRVIILTAVLFLTMNYLCHRCFCSSVLLYAVLIIMVLLMRGNYGC